MVLHRLTTKSVLLATRVVCQVFEFVRLTAVVGVRHTRAGQRRLGHRVDGLVDVSPPPRAAAVTHPARRPVELPEAALRTETAQQRLEEEGGVGPTDGHDDHEEGAELAVREDRRRHHERAGQECRQCRHCHGTAHAGRPTRHPHLSVEVGRQAVRHAVVEREVYGQSYGGRYSDGLENVQLPAEQNERGDRDEDGGGDTEHGVEGDEKV